MQTLVGRVLTNLPDSESDCEFSEATHATSTKSNISCLFDSKFEQSNTSV